MTPEERAKEIADRFTDGLSTDAIRDLTADIADAIRAAVETERQRCAAKADAEAECIEKALASGEELPGARDQFEREVFKFWALARSIRHAG